MLYFFLLLVVIMMLIFWRWKLLGRWCGSFQFLMIVLRVAKSFRFKFISRYIDRGYLHRLSEEISSRKSLLRHSALWTCSRRLLLSHWRTTRTWTRSREPKWIACLILCSFRSRTLLWFRFVSNKNVLWEELLYLINSLLSRPDLCIRNYPYYCLSALWTSLKCLD